MCVMEACEWWKQGERIKDACQEADVRVRPRPGMCHVLVLTELRWICRTGAQGDGSLLNALSRKCYMHMLQYVHRGTLPCAENEKKAVFSFCPSPTIYNIWVTWRVGTEQVRLR